VRIVAISSREHARCAKYFSHRHRHRVRSQNSLLRFRRHKDRTIFAQAMLESDLQNFIYARNRTVAH
jgi:hypothetical protein